MAYIRAEYRFGAAQLSSEDLFVHYGPHYQWYAILTVILGLIAVVLSSTIANVALPDLMRFFHLSEEQVQWVATGFQVTASTFILPTVWLMRRFGIRITYICTLGIFIIVSILGAFSPSAEVLFLSRILEGVCMGIIPSVSMITILRIFPPQHAGRAMGIFGMCAVATPAVSPVVAGMFVHQFGWPVIFLIPLPFAFVGILVAIKFLPGVEERNVDESFDWLGLLLMSAFLLILLSIGQLGHRYGWLSMQLALSAGGASICLLFFVIRQGLVKKPLFEPALFHNVRFAAAILVAVFYNVGSLGLVYLLLLFAQTVGGYTPALSGSLMLPAGIALIVVVGIAGKLTESIQPRFVLMAGLGLFALSSYFFTDTHSNTPFWAMAAWLLIARCGLGLIVPSLAVAAIQTIERSFMAHASIYINFSTQLGGALGINVLSILYEQRTHAYLTGLRVLPGSTTDLLVRAKTLALHDCFWALVMLYVIAMFLAYCIKKGPPHSIAEAYKRPSLS